MLTVLAVSALIFIPLVETYRFYMRALPREDTAVGGEVQQVDAWLNANAGPHEVAMGHTLSHFAFLTRRLYSDIPYSPNLLAVKEYSNRFGVSYVVLHPSDSGTGNWLDDCWRFDSSGVTEKQLPGWLSPAFTIGRFKGYRVLTN
jgi:hypothetical protein